MFKSPPFSYYSPLFCPVLSDPMLSSLLPTSHLLLLLTTPLPPFIAPLLPTLFCVLPFPILYYHPFSLLLIFYFPLLSHYFTSSPPYSPLTNTLSLPLLSQPTINFLSLLHLPYYPSPPNFPFLNTSPFPKLTLLSLLSSNSFSPTSPRPQPNHPSFPHPLPHPVKNATD